MAEKSTYQSKLRSFLDPSSTLTRYGRYFDVIKKLGELPLSTTPMIEEVNNKQALMHRAYREIKIIDFPGGKFLDYVCWISMLYLILDFKKKSLPSWSEFTLFIRESIVTHRAEVFNFLRVFHKNPFILFDSLELNGDKKEAFLDLSALWFDLVMAESQKAGSS